MGNVIHTRDAWVETMEPRLGELYDYGFKNNSDWKKAWIEKQSDSMIERVGEHVKVDVVEETPEGAPNVRLTGRFIRENSVIHVEYSGEVCFTRLMKADKKYSQMEEDSWGLGEAVARKPQEIATALMYNGFGSSLSGDGLPWFSNSHPLAENATKYGKNLLTTPFGPQALNDIRVLGLKTTNEYGKPIPMFDKKIQLFVPPALLTAAQQLKQSQNGGYLPNSANFNPNVFDIDVVCLPYFAMCEEAYADSMYFAQDKQHIKNYYFVREEPRFYMYTDDSTGNSYAATRTRFSFMVAGWRGTIASKGLG